MTEEQKQKIIDAVNNGTALDIMLAFEDVTAYIDPRDELTLGKIKQGKTTLGLKECRDDKRRSE